MPELHLIIADPALRVALVEQLRIAAPQGTQIFESDALSPEFPAAPLMIVIDTLLLDKKAVKILRERHDENIALKIFILGEVDPDLIGDLATESFAKPLRLGHLLARVLLYAQASRAPGEPFAFGRFRLEPTARQAVMEETGIVIRLTEKETNLLEYLGREARPVSQEELLAAVWGYDARIDTHTLETHIYRLRRKLDPEGKGGDVIIVAQGAYSLACVPKTARAR